MQPGRNDPCPCGSGKKYKKCCGAAARTPVSRELGNALSAASNAFREGAFAQALAHCARVLAVDADNAEAHHLSGLTHLRLGDKSRALQHIRFAAARAPHDPYIHNNLAFALLEAGEFADAEAACHRVLKLAPALADAWNLLGNVLKAAGKTEEALDAYRRATVENPREPLFFVNLGSLLHSLGRVEEAEAVYRKALDLSPDLVPALSNLGTLCALQKRWSEADELLRRAHALAPGDAQALNAIGLMFLGKGESSTAREWFERSLVIRPEYAGAWCNLGIALERTDEVENAIAAYLRAASCEPGFIEPRENLMKLCAIRNRPEDAHALARDLIAHGVLLERAVDILQQTCDWTALESAWPAFLQALNTTMVRGAGSFEPLLLLNYVDFMREKDVFAYHCRWGERVASKDTHSVVGTVARAQNGRSEKLRIGYLSPDFSHHSVGLFIRHVIAAHDRSRVEVHCYGNSDKRDGVTEHIQRHADRFFEVTQLTDGALDRLICSHEIDVLVDLAGYTGGTRLTVFGSRLAPVQISYLGYPNTTGLLTMDYRISDPYVDEDGTWYTEKLLRLPESFLCLGALDSPAIDPTPAMGRNGFVTFASFNNLAKISRTTVRLWAAVLQRIPRSRLLVKAKWADSAVVRRHIAAEFVAHGVTEDRLEFMGRNLASTDHLAQYDRVDIALDTTPYGGAMTSCEALWMGVPVVTLAGPLHRQRVTYSILKNIGLAELVAWTEDDYVRIVAGLATDSARLQRMRREIPERLRGSILCDPAKFTRHLEEAYLQAWRAADARMSTPDDSVVSRNPGVY